MGREVRGVAPYERITSFWKQGQYDEILGSKDWELHLYSASVPVSTHNLPREYSSNFSHFHKNTIQALAWSPNGNMVASASRDQTVRVFDIRAMREVQTLRGHKKEVCCTCGILLSSQAEVYAKI